MIMKKHIKLVSLLLACLLVFCACGGSNNSNNGSNSGNNSGNSSGNTFDFNPSEGLDENGYWKDIKASEYVTLPDLETVSTTKADIQKEIDALIAENPNTKQVTDRAVKHGDTVHIDYTGKIDGVAFEGGSTDGEGTDVTIGVDKFIDDMLERLEGHMPGETFDMDATFPDPYEHNTELSGKKAVFTFTIHYILEPTDTFWTNEFVTENLSDYGWASTEEAEEDIAASLKEDAVLAAASFNKEVPEVMIKYNTDTVLAYYNSYAQMYGVDLQSFMVMAMGYQSVEQFKELYKDTAASRAKYYLIYQALAESKGFTISEDDIKAYFKEYTGSEDYSAYEQNSGKPYIKAMIMYEKMSNIIIDAVKLAD